MKKITDDLSCNNSAMFSALKEAYPVKAEGIAGLILEWLKARAAGAPETGICGQA